MAVEMIGDLRHGLVLLRRDACVSALIVLTAIFTLLKAAFLDPLPYRDALEREVR